MKPIRLVVQVLALVSLAATAGAAPSGFAFLQVPAGARAAAMGGAYTAVAQGVDAAFWNPAGLADFTGTQFTATHTETYEHLRHEQVAVAGRLFGGGMAASLRAMYSEPIPERDDLGNLIGAFGSHDLEFLLGYGRTIAGVEMGVTAQHVRERVADLAAGTWAFGAGAAWRVPVLAGARASVSVHHVGGAAHYTITGVQGQAVPLPATLAAGLAWSRPAFRGLDGTLSLEARATRGRAGVFAVGGELAAPVGAALRAGVRAGDDVASWSVGAGWRLGGLSVDYAFVPSKLALDDTHRFSLGARF